MKKLLTVLLLAGALCPLKAEEPKTESYSVVVIGSGIGALTSGVYLGRAGIKHVIIEGAEPGGALAKSHSVQNWPGELDISGAALTDKIHKQAEQSGSLFRAEELVDVDFSTHPFTFTTRDVFDKKETRTIRGDAAIIAMGSTPNWLGIPGEQHYFSRGVYNCALCDGPLFKNKIVAIVGGGDSAITEAHYLSRIAKQVYVFVRKGAFRGTEEKRRQEVLATPNIKVFYNTTVEEVKGNEEHVTTLVVKEKGKIKKIDADALFLAIGSSPNTKLFKDKLDLNKAGFIVTKKGTETSVPGVFAIGDITTNPCKQAVSAAGDGANATMQVEHYLLAGNQSAKGSGVTATKRAMATTQEVVEITSEKQFEEAIKDTSVAIYVDFYAPWCGPCKQILPRLDKWAEQLAGKAKFLKVNVDTQTELAEKYKIQALPTLILIDSKGNVIDRKTGTDEISKSMIK